MAPVEAALVSEDAASAEMEDVSPDLTGEEIPNMAQYVLHFSI